MEYLKTIRIFLHLKTLDQMYKALVRSHLNYCDVIYHIPSITHQTPLGTTLSSLMEKVEKVQYQAALAITGAWQGSSRFKIYDELGWETLSGRRKYRRVLQIHKIIIIILFRIFMKNYDLTAEKCLVEICVLLFMQ